MKQELPILGIIAGSGDLPAEIARIYTKNGGNCFVASLSEPVNAKGVKNENFEINKVGKILAYFKENQVENVILIGGMKRPDLKALKVDIAGASLLAKILKNKILGDDNLLKVVAGFIESKGYKVISAQDILAMDKKDKYIESSPNIAKSYIKDIDLGATVLESLGSVDVGQSIIIEDGYVIGIEAAEGTDELIKRCSYLRKKKEGGVLVKMAKSAQDMRLDIPVIGPETIKILAKYKYAGFAINKKNVIIIKPKEVEELSKKSNLFMKLLD